MRKKQCTKYKQWLEKKGYQASASNSENQASVAEIEEERACDVLSAHSERFSYSDIWILDSGCSYHMCPERSWFHTYEEFDGGAVLMGNDATVKTVGIGNIKVKMFDGKVRTLTNVRHVPDLKKNLVSLGALTANGCKFVGEGTDLKVVKGSLVMIKGQRFAANLYKMIGSTVTGDAAVGSEEEVEDTSKLWHMRLGHMSRSNNKNISSGPSFTIHGSFIIPVDKVH